MRQSSVIIKILISMAEWDGRQSYGRSIVGDESIVFYYNGISIYPGRLTYQPPPLVRAVAELSEMRNEGFFYENCTGGKTTIYKS